MSKRKIDSKMGEAFPCVDCGTTLYRTGSRQARCKACAAKHTAIMKREWQRKYGKRRDNKAERDMQNAEKRRIEVEQRNSILSKAARDAAERNTSYGKLMAPAVVVTIPMQFREAQGDVHLS